jgi:hypothetical protein
MPQTMGIRILPKDDREWTFPENSDFESGGQ